MKAVLPLILSLTFGAMALANTEIDVKINSIEMGVVLDCGTNGPSASSQAKVNTANGVARLYKFQNSRIKKALSFTTKHSKSKWV